jgi:acetoacetate decarboxylase
MKKAWHHNLTMSAYGNGENKYRAISWPQTVSVKLPKPLKMGEMVISDSIIRMNKETGNFEAILKIYDESGEIISETTKILGRRF